MTSIIWDSLREIRGIVASGDLEASASKVDGMLNAVMESVADTLPSATTQRLREGAEAAIAALNTVRSKKTIDRASIDFAAGRLAAVADILGYAAVATADEAAIERARQQPYARILQEMFEAPLRNIDLAVRLGVHKSQVSRYMSDLREMEMVTSHQSGREVFNALTPVARLVVEEGIERRSKVPIADSNVHRMKSYTLDGRAEVRDTVITSPPLVRACG